LETKQEPISRWLEIEALMEAVSWPGATARPAMVLANGLMAARRDEDGYRYFRERAEEQPQNPLFLALEATFQARLAATQLVEQAGPSMVEALGKLDRAVSLAPGMTTYFRGLVLAERAAADLEWVLAARDSFPPGTWRGLYRGLAKAYRSVGREAASREMLARSGYPSLDDGVPLFAGDSWLTLRDGFRFRPPRLLDVAPGVRVAQGYDFGDFAFIETEDGVVAIDSGTTESNANAALTELRKITSKPVTHVILTHAHWDHVGGLEAIKRPGTQVIAQAGFEAVLQVVNDTALPVTEWFGKEAGRHYDVVPDHLVKERETLKTGGVELVLYPARGGETSDGLLIHLPASGLLFVGDVLMPYLGAPFLPEGSAEGYFETIDLVQRLRPRLMVHGHTGLTENVTIELVPVFGAALRELYDHVLNSIREGDTLSQVLRRNLLPAVLRSAPEAVLPYLLTRDNLIQRLYHQRTGYWKSNGEGVLPNGPEEWGRVLDLLAGGREEAFVDAARTLNSSSDYGLGFQLIELGLAVHPTSQALTELRGRTLDGLRGRYQLLDPFRFVWFSHQQQAELLPADPGTP
jgi:glyoxylase-like metal-dependent hydrolase (beta-lactamase superfamily II)